VTETIAPTAEITRTSATARIGWAVLILATLYVCYFSHLGAIGFVGPDEPRYAWIARDMAETGDWVTPRLYGKPWFEKPPLFYWGAALSFKLFGVSEAAARLPSAISALLATLALAWLALRLYGAETARWLLLLLPTTVGMIGFSHAASTDMPFSAMLTIAMVCAAVVLGLTRDENTPILPRTPWLALILFGFFLGLAVLAKGPAAIILCGGAIFFWALFAKRWRDVFRLCHPVAIASFCLTALPWYILCARRNPDFFRIFIIEHNFKRYLTPEFQHIQPFWFYVPIALIALFPWMTAMISALGIWARMAIRGKTESSETDAISVLFLAYAGFVILFFSLSKSKLPGYILPTIPMFGFITAKWLALEIRNRKYWKTRGLAVISLTGTAFLGIVSIQALIWKGHPQPKLYALVGIAIAILGATSTIMCARLGMQGGILGSGVFVVVLFLACANSSFLHWLDTVVSPRPIARIVTSHQNLASNVFSYRLNRGWLYGTNFYLRRQLQEWNGAYAQPVMALVSPDGLKDLRERKIPFTVLDHTCLGAMLIEIGRNDTLRRQQGTLSSSLFQNGMEQPLPDSPCRRGQPR
jgi:4-amino-4-deoxy-L-arabinose transferase-like glycosyltransferase